MKKQKIFIACDTNDIRKLKNVIKKTQTKKLSISYKIGLEFFLSQKGRTFISKIKGKEIFLDLKLNDIPNTCFSAISSLKDLTMSLLKSMSTFSTIFIILLSVTLIPFKNFD